MLFCSTILKHGRHFDHRNQPLNMRMRVCHVVCHEAGLCCYILIGRNPITSITAVLFPFVTRLWLSLLDIGDYRRTKWSMIMSFGSFYKSVRCLIV
jgi:hypothetical protein